MLHNVQSISITRRRMKKQKAKGDLIGKAESIDGLFGNKVKVIQALQGYRVSEDALILTWFVKSYPGEFILDVGTGCGIIAFGLALKQPETTIVGLEIQSALARRAGLGLKLNHLESSVSILPRRFTCTRIFFLSMAALIASYRIPRITSRDAGTSTFKRKRRYADINL